MKMVLPEQKHVHRHGHNRIEGTQSVITLFYYEVTLKA